MQNGSVMDSLVNMITLVGFTYLEKNNLRFSWDVVIGKPNLTRLYIISRIRSNYMYLSPTKARDEVLEGYKNSASLRDVEVGYVESFDYQEFDVRMVTDFAVFIRQIAHQFDYGFSVFIDAPAWGPLVESLKHFGIEAEHFKFLG